MLVSPVITCGFYTNPSRFDVDTKMEFLDVSANHEDMSYEFNVAHEKEPHLLHYRRLSCKFQLFNPHRLHPKYELDYDGWAEYLFLELFLPDVEFQINI